MIGEDPNGIPMRVLKCLSEGENDLRGLRAAVDAASTSTSKAILQLVRAGYAEVVDETIKRRRTYRFVCWPDPGASVTWDQVSARHGVKRKKPKVKRIEDRAPAPYWRGLRGWGAWL